ncbi:MAG TPA: hypothetical protein VFA33_05980 [Bryobacteraceae bacterium]|nr:hypothetical protein [Bryobacteraceae bacterium]
MANSNQVELVVTVEVDKANSSIKSVNANLSGIEQTAVRAARGASQGIDGMTASMVKGATAGNLLADAIKKAIEFAKEWTVEAAKEAAQAERAAAVTQGLAKAHGDSAAAASKAVEAVRAVGFTAADATVAVQKLIIADIGLDKAKGLAKIAKDAAAMSTEGDNARTAFEKIMLAIETGQSRGLRTLSLFPDLAKAEQVARLQAQLHGKTLSDNEVQMIRYNAIVEAATKIQGAAGDEAGTVAGQMKALGREVTDLKEDVGKAFQGELKAVVGHLKDMVAWLKDNIGLIEKFGQMAIWLAGILATYAIATKILGIAAAVKALTVALAANPWALLITGVVAAGAIVYKEYSDMQETWERRTQEMQNNALRNDLFKGKVKIDDLRKRGMTDDQIRELVSGRKSVPGMDEEGSQWELGAGLPKIKIAGQPDPEELKRQIEIQKRQRENEKYFRDQAIGSRLNTIMVNGKPMEVPLSGFAKDVADINKEIASKTTWVDDNGEHHVPLTKKAWDSIIEYANNKLKAFLGKSADENKKALADYVKDQEDAAHKQMEWEAHRFQQRLQNDTEIAQRNLDHLKEVYGFEEQRAGFERDARLRQVEGQDAVTLQQKVAVEAQKAQIEIDYLEKVHKVKQALYDIETRQILDEEELTMKRLGYRADEIKARIDELKGQRQEIRDENDEANDAAIKAARENAANRQAQLVRDHNKAIFDSLKQQAGGIFDALLQKSQSVWSAIANSFKTAILTAIKEVVTSRVAALLMQMFTGQKVTFEGGGAGPGGAGGILGGLGGLLGIGAVPVFGSTSPGGGVIPGVTPGTTPPFNPGGGGITSKAGAGGLLNFNWSNLKSLASWKNLYGAMTLAGGMLMLSGMQKGSAFSTIGGGALMGAGIGLSGGPIGAIGGAGIGLYMDAMRRGGWGGVAEGTAGGAMFGWNVGGPLGAAIGAGVGFLSGIVRLFVKGATEKAHDKVKALYGVDITDKAVLQQIVDMAKQSCGGNLDMAIRTQPVRDLIQLYGMSTGKDVKGIPATMQPLNLAQRGGSLYQAPSYSNGTALPGLGGLPTLDSIGGGVASGAQPVVIQLDGPATTSLLQGQAVQAIASNPRVVQSAVMSASKSNAGRRELTSLQLSPGLVTS